MMKNARGIWFVMIAIAPLTLFVLRAHSHAPVQRKRLDPAAWGGDHVGKPVPEFVTGDECLFCHRKTVGATWGGNRHNLTIRPIDEQSPALAALKKSSLKNLVKDIRYVMGNTQRQRLLKPSKDYGKLDIHSAQWKPPRDDKPGELIETQQAQWLGNHFGQSCAGCHTTGVDSKRKVFSALSLDCFACHGDIHPDHTKKPELAYFSKKRNDPPRVVNSICAQCHLRGGKSKSSGLPYPNNFVAGDNLFRDFQVDFTDANLDKASTADRHVLRNVRDVVLFRKEDLTCLSCHDVHAGSSKKHRRLTKSAICLDCHHATGPSRVLKAFTTHSKTCGYLK